MMIGNKRIVWAAVLCALCLFAAAADDGEPAANEGQPAAKKEFANSLVPGFTGGFVYLMRSGLWYYGGELRFDFLYGLDHSRKSARAPDRGRGEVFASVGLYYSPRPDGELFFHYLLGFTTSLESPRTLARNFFIPYLGLAAGGITIKDRGSGFLAYPLAGLNIVSLETFSLSLETGVLLPTVAFEEFWAVKADLVILFVL